MLERKKRMKKRIFCLVLTIVLSMGMLACGKENVTDASKEAKIIEGDRHPYIGTKQARHMVGLDILKMKDCL